MGKWNTDKIPDLSNKIAIVTGGNQGLGYYIGLELARKNAKLIIACRTKEKGLKAVQNIEKTLNRKVESDVICLNLTDINSVRAFANEFSNKYQHLDILINNAGVISLKERQETKNGVEMHLATNHLGHFALVGFLLPQIKNSSNARIVTMSSGGYRYGELDFDDMNWKKREYDKVKCYGTSKLANLLFMVELDRLFKLNNYSAVSVGAHPGLSASDGQKERADNLFLKTMAQPIEMGILPALMAATVENVKGKSYYGPRWFIRGYPKLEKMKEIVFNKELTKKLWEFSEKSTKVKYKF